MSSNGEQKAMSKLIGSDPDLLRFLNDIRWEFPDSKLLYVEKDGVSFGNPNGPGQKPTEFSVDLYAELDRNRVITVAKQPKKPTRRRK